MNVKTAIVTAILFASFPVTIQAQEIDNYENYQVGCDSGTECNDFDVIYEGESEDNSEISQRRTRRTRRRTSFNKYYAGGNIGAFFPGDDADVGFGLGGLFGYRFTKNASAELEVFDYFGGTEVDDLGYNFLGIAANGSYKFPFNQSNPKSVYGFGTVGLGYGRVAATGDVADEAEDLGVDTSESGFLLQGKLGIGYPVSDSVDLYGQFRYVNIFVDGNGDAFSLDVGANFGF